MMGKQKMTAEQASEMYPVGTKVRYYPVAGENNYEESVVRSSAWALGHGELVVKINGRAGGVAISHLEFND